MVVLLGILFCIYTIPKIGQNDSAVCISVRANSSEIYVNGEKKNISSAPYLFHNIMFVSYDSVASILGGSVHYLNNGDAVFSSFAQIGTMDKDISLNFNINSSDLSVIGEEEVAPGLAMNSAGGDISAYRVERKEDIVYVPIDFFQRARVAKIWQEPNSDRATISNRKEYFSAGPFELEQNFCDLEPAVQKEFHAVGDAEYIADNDKRQIYTNGQVDLLLSDTNTINLAINSQEQIIKEIILKDQRYATDSGLRVGDSESKYEDLYAGNDFSATMYVVIQDGKVTQITFESHS